jgi:hypothetical protein
MKLALRLATVIATLAVGSATAAQIADDASITFNGYPVPLNDGSYMVGLGSYTGDLGAFLAWCIDRDAQQVSQGQSYTVDVYTIDHPNLWSLLGLSGYDDLRAMAWLGKDFNNTNPDTTYRHHAIWEIANPGTYNLTGTAAAYRANALANAGSINGLQYLVALPAAWGTAQSVGQPIMWENPNFPPDDTTVPEPSSVALLVSGLAGGIVIHRRRRAQQQ